MKSSRMQILGILATGGLLGYIAACNNAKPAGDVNAAPTKSDTSSQATSQQSPAAKPGQLAQAPATTALAAVGANGKKPNIIVIWGDDIGQSNLSCFTHGLMGYRTPNIDRLAREGMLFTDYMPNRVAPRGDRRSSPARPSFVRV